MAGCQTPNTKGVNNGVGVEVRSCGRVWLLFPLCLISVVLQSTTAYPGTRYGSFAAIDKKGNVWVRLLT